MIALVEHDLACNGDVELELSLTPDPLSLLRPGGIFLARIGDPRAATVEQLRGATVCWERTPDPLDADPGDCTSSQAAFAQTGSSSAAR